MRVKTILNQVRISFAILAAAAVMAFSPCAGIRAKAADTYTITYEAGENGKFSNGSSENKVTYSFTHHDTSITKYSHTANIDDPSSLKADTTVYAKISKYTVEGTWRTCPWGITKDGVLEIGAGTGAEQTGTKSPWSAYGDKITAIKAIGAIKAPANCKYLFNGLSKVTSADLKKIDTGSVKDMRGMFQNCRGLASLDISNWNTGSVTDMSYMFCGCNSLTSLDVSNWNTGNVKYMIYMFCGCKGFTSLDVSNWNTSSVTDMDNMFKDCSSLTSLDLSNWNTGSVTDMRYMFWNCSGLASLDLSNWNTSSVTNMTYMFKNCSSLTSLDVSNWNTSSVTNMYATFSGCKALTSLDVSNWNTGSVTNMSYMFPGCSSLTSLDVSNWNTNKVTNMSNMFYGCSNLISLDVSNWNTSKVTNMPLMFNGCNGLTSLDVSNWNTNKVTNMSNMFYGCSNLISLDVSNWNTSKVTNMSLMFNGCNGLTSLDVSNWNTSSVTDMSWMFPGCSSLTSLDVSNWNTNKVTNMSNMFSGCTALTSLDVSNWDTGSVTRMSQMFQNCSSLNTVSFGTKWTKPLSGGYFPSTTDWRKKRDADGTKLTDKTEYTLVNAKAASGTDATIVVPQTADSAKTVTLAGTWKRAAFDCYEDLGDGDIRYDSQDIVAGAGDTDTGNKWVKQGNKWIYKFKVFDDSRTYYLTEDDMDGYTKQFASTGTSGYGIINKTGDTSKSDTVTNTSINETVLTIEKQITAQDGSAVTEEDSSKMFPFTVTLKDGNGNALSGTLVFGNTVFKDGMAHVSASANVPMSITGIPAGYSYTVAEEDTAGYVKPAPQTGTIDAKNSNLLTFTNIKEKVKPASEGNYCTLTVTKKVTERFGAAVPSDKYSFTVDFSGLKKNSTYYKGDNTTFTATESGTASVECVLGDGESAVFYVPAGAKYVVTEKAGSYTASYAVTGSSDITRDSGKNTDENKPLSTAEETLSDGENNTVLFTNDIEVKQNLTIRKFTGTGDETKTDTFDFTADQKDKAPDEKFNFQIAFYNLQEGDSFPSDIGRIKAQEPADADDIAAGAAENTYTAKKDFTLKGGESISFSGIPVGVKYIVTEKETPCAVQCVVEGTDVATGKEGNTTASKGAVVTPYTAKTHPTAMETVDPNENGIVTFNNRRSSTAALQIIKKGSGSERLEGAVFVVCDESGTPLTYADGNTMILTSESSGYTNIVNGLAAGTYLIKETKVPDGYTAMEPYTLTVTDKDFGTLITLTFKDDKLVELPSTGGPGTVLYTVLFTIAAAAFLGIVLRQKTGRQA